MTTVKSLGVDVNQVSVSPSAVDRKKANTEEFAKQLNREALKVHLILFYTGMRSFFLKQLATENRRKEEQ